MKMTKQVLSYVPQIGDHEKALECHSWLKQHGFVIEYPEARLIDNHGFSPSVGTVFIVNEPLESCGNTPNGREHCPLLMPGFWITVQEEDCTSSSPSSMSSTFRCLFDQSGPDWRVPSNSEVRLRVGYSALGGGPAIMAWKDHIKLIKRVRVKG